MKCYNPASFNVPFSVQPPDRQEDDCGGYTNDSWKTAIPVLWCSYAEKSGGEYFKRQELRNESVCELITYYRTDITELQRLVDEEGNYYNIRRVTDIEKRHRYLRIIAELGVPD